MASERTQSIFSSLKFCNNGRMNMPNHQSRLKEVIIDDDGNGGKGKKKLMRRRTTVVDGNHFMAITNKMTQASVI